MASRDLTTNFIERRSAANLRRRGKGWKPFGTSFHLCFSRVVQNSHSSWSSLHHLIPCVSSSFFERYHKRRLGNWSNDGSKLLRLFSNNFKTRTHISTIFCLSCLDCQSPMYNWERRGYQWHQNFHEIIRLWQLFRPSGSMMWMECMLYFQILPVSWVS